MKSAAVVMLAAIAAQGVLAGTPPQVVNRSGEDKSCPPGFTFFGKQCAQQVSVPVEVHCPSGTQKEGDQCVKYSSKITQCPPGYTQSKGICTREETAEPLFRCKDGWEPIGDGSLCSRSLPNPPQEYCPSGTVRKGDNCVSEAEVEPELTCAPGSQLVPGTKRCRSETVFDCTPPRQVQTFTGKGLRNLAGKEGSYTKAKVPMAGKNQPDLNEEYVVSKTCKRIHTEDAHKICPKGGRLSGKHCLVEETSPVLERPGGYTTETAPAKLDCPEGFGRPEKLGKGGVCRKSEEVAPESFCKAGTTQIGNRCAEFQPLIISCPSGYILEGDACIKTIYAPPTIEYTVKYQCTGKECAGH